jgi:23S rRNA pseudouridine1911/1915/1917 synthase
MKEGFKVSANDAGKRLDIWLCANTPDCSRKRAKRLLDGGKVFVNGKRVFIAGWKLMENDEVRILEGGEEKRHDYVRVLYEDKDVIVVDKPAGIISVSVEKGKTSMARMVHDYLRRKYAGSAGSYIRPLHRLDTETSGVMVFAKSREAGKMEDLFRSHKIERRYIAVVCGAVSSGRGRIDVPLEKGSFAGGRKVRPAEGRRGKEAVTQFEVKERYARATLLELNVHTGRTHQIRAHLAHAGHPIVGDKLYGGSIPFSRQALHAHVLGFVHPTTGKHMRFRSPIPNDMRKLIEKFRQET